MGNVRLAVIGAGRIGRVHAENASFRVPGAEVVAVADVMRSAAEACAARVRAQKATDRIEEVLADHSVDAVVIASSTDTHARLIAEAARSGKHVFCEKPIDLDLEKIDAAIAEVKRAGVLFQVGFNRRFDPSFQKARELVQAGKVGEPQLLRITSRDPKPPPIDYVKVSGGLFADMTIHDFDVARWMMGDEVEELFAFSGNLVDPAIREVGDIDTAVVSLRYGSGALGSIDNSRRAVYGYDVRVEVFGSDGVVQVGNLPPSTVTVGGVGGYRSDGPLFWFIERFEQAYVNELRHFVDCVSKGIAPSVGAADGRAPVLLARAASRSLAERRPLKVER
ncbi:MAG: inositol 2-dehydrogenase [Myxococcales bacterium]|nr:inositol 2-dehydrogenase [Myxococcales bacterium]